MIQIKVNGETVRCMANTLQEAIDDLLKSRCITEGFAAAVNGGFVPKAHYAETILLDGDEVEILSPMQGG